MANNGFSSALTYQRLQSTPKLALERPLITWTGTQTSAIQGVQESPFLSPFRGIFPFLKRNSVEAIKNEAKLLAPNRST